MLFHDATCTALYLVRVIKIKHILRLIILTT